MRAIVVDRPGGIDCLSLQNQPDPIPSRGDVLIETAFASCNWGDIEKRKGVYPDPISYPVVLGEEISGRIVSRGPNVKRFTVGDRVAAITGPHLLGGYAERCAVPEEYVIPLPGSISLELGAAFPIVSLTAYHLVHSAFRLRKRDTVLVHAIGGAVGLMLIQVITAYGPKVIGTVGSPRKATRALEYGAQKVVVRGEEDFVEAALNFTNGRGVDLIIDSLGGDVLPRSFEALATYGQVINIGEAAGFADFAVLPKLYERSTSLAGFEVLHAQPGSQRWKKGVGYVVDGLAAGRLKMPIEGTYPMEQCAEMHRRLEERQVSGKLLLRVTPESDKLA
jgi:NADPH2:quinone reductase